MRTNVLQQSILSIINNVLASIHSYFKAISVGRIDCPSIPPKRMLNPPPLSNSYVTRSAHQMRERLKFNLKSHSFTRLQLDDSTWAQMKLCAKQTPPQGDLDQNFPAVVLAQPKLKPTPSIKQFSAGTWMIEGWAPINVPSAKKGSGELPTLD